MDFLVLIYFTNQEIMACVSVISAPKLKMLGRLTDKIGRFEFGATVFQVLVIIYVPFSVCCAMILIDPYAIQGFHLIRLATVMRSVRVLALLDSNLSLDVIINFMRCFPCLEKLYIKGNNNFGFAAQVSLTIVYCITVASSFI